MTLRENVTRRRIDGGRYRWRHHGPRAPRRPARSRLVALAGCGGTADVDRPNEEASLLLDFTPNGVHTGIYLALGARVRPRRGRRARGPRAGRVDRRAAPAPGRPGRHGDPRHPRPRRSRAQEGADIVGVMALVQRPLAAVLAAPDVRRPRDLEGRRAGVTGLPSDVAVLRSVVAGDGGDPAPVRTTTIGFEAVKALLAEPRRRAPPRSGTSRAWRCARGGADAGVPRRRLRRARRTRSSCSASPARRSRSAAPVVRGHDPRAPARLRRRPDGPGERRRARCSRPRAASTARPPRRSSTPSPRRSRPAPAPTASCARTCCASGRAWDAEFGILERAPDVGARVRLHARRAGLEPLSLTRSRRPAGRPVRAPGCSGT